MSKIGCFCSNVDRFSPGHIERLFREIATRESDDTTAVNDRFGPAIVGAPAGGASLDQFASLLRGDR